ncbi:hypothetical protein BDN72DRAFT_905719 [Pluteus cervinus]|uniref:Uncharacterized protein n=1 Tax=Pluteus cervinus TaxID=181527 RepID=A0ACD3A1Z9_9AGAR|nr:hypothetical protein BDN72DRAFT_905719 [Pluteus cervinus]
MAEAVDFDAFDSDLTELESSDDEDNKPLLLSRNPPPSKRKSKQPPSEPCLDPARGTSYSIEYLYKSVKDKTIELNPPYQRDVVWNHDKQSNLIDSLFHNFYVPSLLFCRIQDAEGFVRFICIDGKQRLTSIVNFIDGVIPHKDSQTGAKIYYRNKNGKKNKVISEQLRRVFENKQIQCMEYNKLTLEQQRAIFQRVQNGVSLTPAERMRSLNGKGPELVRYILSEYSGIFGPNPGPSQFKWVAQVLVMISTSPVHILKRSAAAKAKAPEAEVTVNRIETFLQKSIFTDAAQKILLDVMCILQVLVTEDAYSKPFQIKPELTPLDYVFAAHLVHTKRAHLSLAQLSSLFAQVRKDSRKSGSKVTGAVYKKSMKLIADASNDSQSSSAVIELADILPSAPSSDNRASLTPRRVSGVKRERAVLEDQSSIPAQTPSAKKQKLCKPASDIKDSKLLLTSAAQRDSGPSRKGIKRPAHAENDAYDSDDEASIRPVKPTKPRTSASRASVVAPTKPGGTSKAATTVKRLGTKVKTQASAAHSPATQSAPASRTAMSRTPSASQSTLANQISKEMGPKRAVSTPKLPSSHPTPTLPTATPSWPSGCAGASSQATSSRPSSIVKSVSTKGLATVATRTQDPRRRDSETRLTGSLSAPPSAATTPVLAPPTQPISAPLGQCSTTPRDPRPRPLPLPKPHLQATPQAQASSSTFSPSLNPSVIPTGPSVLSSHQLDQNSVPFASSISSQSLLNIGSTVTVSSPLVSSSRPQCPYQHQVPKDVLGAELPPLRRKM